jgi:hypothetical protein
MMSPLAKSAVFYGITTACMSIIIPFSDALVMGIAGIIFNPFNIDGKQ